VMQAPARASARQIREAHYIRGETGATRFSWRHAYKLAREKMSGKSRLTYLLTRFGRHPQAKAKCPR